MKRWFIVWGPAIAQLAAIFVASSVPNLEHLPGGMSDKAGHSIGYALLAALLLRALASARWTAITPRTAFRAWLFTAAYGVSDELHQHFVPGRTVAVDDWVADAAGGAGAVLVVLLIAWILSTRAAHRESREV